MLKKMKEINELEKLERRTKQEWETQGTKEEAIQVIEFKKKKRRNNEILIVGASIIGAILYKKGLEK